MKISDRKEVRVLARREIAKTPAPDPFPRRIGVSLDGGGAAIPVGPAGDLYVPTAGTIVAVTMIAETISGTGTGSIVVDIWADDLAVAPLDDSSSITGSTPPTISGETTSRDTVLTGWSPALAAGSIIRFNVDSCTDLKRLTLTLEVE